MGNCSIYKGCQHQAVSKLAATARATAGLACNHALEYRTSLATPLATVVAVGAATILNTASLSKRLKAGDALGNHFITSFSLTTNPQCCHEMSTPPEQKHYLKLYCTQHCVINVLLFILHLCI